MVAQPVGVTPKRIGPVPYSDCFSFWKQGFPAPSPSFTSHSPPVIHHPSIHPPSIPLLLSLSLSPSPLLSSPQTHPTSSKRSLKFSSQSILPQQTKHKRVFRNVPFLPPCSRFACVSRHGFFPHLLSGVAPNF